MRNIIRNVKVNSIAFIEKTFSTKENFLAEYSVYKKGLDSIPKLFSADESTLTLVIEFIDCEVLENVERPDFTQLAGIIGSLHQYQMDNGKVLCHWDTNLRNYLVSVRDAKYYMIDFEYTRMEYPEADLAHFLTYWSYLYKSNHYCPT